jgi:hypothetical protein
MQGPHDFGGNRYTGQFYEQSTGRGIVAWKGSGSDGERKESPADRVTQRAGGDRLV